MEKANLLEMNLILSIQKRTLELAETRLDDDRKFRSRLYIFPRALDSVNLVTIRRNVAIYGFVQIGKLAEYAAKKYKSHRRIPEDAWDELRTN